MMLERFVKYSCASSKEIRLVFLLAVYAVPSKKSLSACKHGGGTKNGYWYDALKEHSLKNENDSQGKVVR